MKGSKVQRFKGLLLLLVCLALTACETVAQAAEAPQVIVAEPTQVEYRVLVITDAMRSAMDASLQPEAHECRVSPLGIYWHDGAKQYAITCKLSYAVDQYGIVYFNEDGGLLNTAVIQSYDYSDVARGLMWMGFKQ